jgi:hypothetical protein
MKFYSTSCVTEKPDDVLKESYKLISYRTSKPHGLKIIPIDWILRVFPFSNCQMFFLQIFED